MLTLRRYSDAMIGVVFLIIAGFYFKGTFLEKSAFMQAEYGAEFLPRIYVALFAVFSVMLIIRNIRAVTRQRVEGQEKPEPEKQVINKHAILRTAATIVLLILYVSALKFVGFLLSSAIYMSLQLCILAPRNKMRPVRFVVFSVAGAVILSYIFVNFFYVKLPAGLFGF